MSLETIRNTNLSSSEKNNFNQEELNLRIREVQEKEQQQELFSRLTTPEALDAAANLSAGPHINMTEETEAGTSMSESFYQKGSDAVRNVTGWAQRFLGDRLNIRIPGMLSARDITAVYRDLLDPNSGLVVDGSTDTLTTSYEAISQTKDKWSLVNNTLHKIFAIVLDKSNPKSAEYLRGITQIAGASSRSGILDEIKEYDQAGHKGTPTSTGLARLAKALTKSFDTIKNHYKVAKTAQQVGKLDQFSSTIEKTQVEGAEGTGLTNTTGEIRSNYNLIYTKDGKININPRGLLKGVSALFQRAASNPITAWLGFAPTIATGAAMTQDRELSIVNLVQKAISEGKSETYVSQLIMKAMEESVTKQEAKFKGGIASKLKNVAKEAISLTSLGSVAVDASQYAKALELKEKHFSCKTSAIMEAAKLQAELENNEGPVSDEQLNQEIESFTKDSTFLSFKGLFELIKDQPKMWNTIKKMGITTGQLFLQGRVLHFFGSTALEVADNALAKPTGSLLDSANSAIEDSSGYNVGQQIEKGLYATKIGDVSLGGDLAVSLRNIFGWTSQENKLTVDLQGKPTEVLVFSTHDVDKINANLNKDLYVNGDITIATAKGTNLSTVDFAKIGDQLSNQAVSTNLSLSKNLGTNQVEFTTNSNGARNIFSGVETHQISGNNEQLFTGQGNSGTDFKDKDGSLYLLSATGDNKINGAKWTSDSFTKLTSVDQYQATAAKLSDILESSKSTAVSSDARARRIQERLAKQNAFLRNTAASSQLNRANPVPLASNITRSNSLNNNSFESAKRTPTFEPSRRNSISNLNRRSSNNFSQNNRNSFRSSEPVRSTTLNRSSRLNPIVHRDNIPSYTPKPKPTIPESRSTIRSISQSKPIVESNNSDILQKISAIKERRAAENRGRSNQLRQINQVPKREVSKPRPQANIQLNQAPKWEAPTSLKRQNRQINPAPKFEAPKPLDRPSTIARPVPEPYKPSSSLEKSTPRTVRHGRPNLSLTKNKPTLAIEKFGDRSSRIPVVEYGDPIPSTKSSQTLERSNRGSGSLESSINRNRSSEITKVNRVQTPKADPRFTVVPKNKFDPSKFNLEAGYGFNNQGDVVVPVVDESAIKPALYPANTLKPNKPDLVVPTIKNKSESLVVPTISSERKSNSGLVVPTRSERIPSTVVPTVENNQNQINSSIQQPSVDNSRSATAVNRSSTPIIPDAISNPLLAYEAKSNRLFNRSDNKAELTGKFIGELSNLDKRSYKTYRTIAILAANGQALPTNLKGINLPKGLTSDLLYQTLSTDRKLAREIADKSITIQAIGSFKVNQNSKTSALVLPLPGMVLGSAEGKESTRVFVAGKSAMATNDIGYDIVNDQNYQPVSNSQASFEPQVIQKDGKITVTYPGNRVKIENTDQEFTLVTNDKSYKIDDPRIIRQIQSGKAVSQREVLDYIAKTDPQNSLVKNSIDIKQASSDLTITDKNGKKRDLVDLLAKNSSSFFTTENPDGSSFQNPAVSKDVVNKEDGGLLLYLLSPKSNLSNAKKAALLREVQNSSYVVEKLVRGTATPREKYLYGGRKFLEEINSPLLNSGNVYENEVVADMSKTSFDAIDPIIENSKQALVDAYKSVTKKYDRYLVGSGKRILQPEKSSSNELIKALGDIEAHLERKGIRADEFRSRKNKNSVEYNTRKDEIATIQSLLGQKPESITESKKEGVSLGLSGLSFESNYGFDYRNQNVISDNDTQSVRTALENNPDLKKVTNSVTFAGPIPIPGVYLDPLKTKIATGALSQFLPAGGIYSQKRTATFSEMNFTPQQLNLARQQTEATINILSDKQINARYAQLLAGSGNNGMTPKEALMSSIPTKELNGKYYAGNQVFSSATERNQFLDRVWSARQSLVTMEASQLNGKGRTSTSVDLFRNPEFSALQVTEGSQTATKGDFEQMVRSSNVRNANVLAKKFEDSFNAVNSNKKMDLPVGQKQTLTPAEFARQVGHYPAGAGVFGDGKGNLKTEYFVGTKPGDKILIDPADLAKARTGQIDSVWAKIVRCDNLLKIPIYKPQEFTISQGAEFTRSSTNTLQEDIYASQTTEETKWNLAAFLKLPRPSPEQSQPEPQPEQRVEIESGGAAPEAPAASTPGGDIPSPEPVTPIEPVTPGAGTPTTPGSTPGNIDLPTPKTIPQNLNINEAVGNPVTAPASTPVNLNIPTAPKVPTTNLGTGIGNPVTTPASTPVFKTIPNAPVAPVAPTPIVKPVPLPKVKPPLDITGGAGGAMKLPTNPK
ncbi:MAG: hypothetical protein AAGF07_03000 [Patescibacteria group bacterium]